MVRKELDHRLVEVLLKLFVNRLDTYAVQKEDGSYRRVKKPLTKKLLSQHLEGKITLGCYQIDPAQNKVKWLCFDVDPEKIRKPVEVALKIFEQARYSFGPNAVLLEASRYPDQSFHVWIFFAPPIPANVARFLGQNDLKILKLEDVGVELFPKQEKVSEGGFGNLMKLPLGIHRKYGKRSCFLDSRTTKPLPDDYILKVQGRRMSEKSVRKLSQLLSEVDKAKFVENKTSYKIENPACIRKLLEGVDEGNRNEAGIRLACFLLNFRGLKRGKTRNILRDWNSRNKPPLPKKELQNIIESASRKGYNFGCNDEMLKGFCEDREHCPIFTRLLQVKKAEEEAESILNSVDVLKALKPHLDNVLAGEDENKQLAFILLLSGKVNDPALKQILLLKGESGAGKTTLMRLAEAFKTKNVGRFSAHALDYSNLEEYEILRLKEIGKMDQEFQGVSTIKFLSSNDRGYTVEVTERDEKGRFTTKQHGVPAITLITSTTRVVLDQQFLRRSWVLNPDESKEQTSRIRLWKARREREKGLVSLGFSDETSYDQSMTVLKNVVGKLEPYQVVLIFPESLTRLLKSDRLRVRGDYDKIIGLVKLHAFLHQRTLPKAKGSNAQTIVFVTPRSAFQALSVALRPFITMTTELEERSRKLIAIIKDMELSSVGDEIDHEIRAKIAVRMGVSDRTVYRYLKEWCEAGYMSSLRDMSSKGHPVIFRLLYDLDSIFEKTGVSFDIDNANTQIGSDMRKEIEDWLKRFSDKIVPRKEWSREEIKRVLLEEVKSPNRAKLLSEKENEKKISSVARTKQDSLDASFISKEKGLDSQKKTISSNSDRDIKCCWMCNGPLPTDSRDITFLDGRPVHLECFRENKERPQR